MNPLHYELSSEGEGIVFLHGFAGSHQWWWQQKSFFDSDYQVLTVDLPGHGQSSWRPMSLIQIAQCLRDLILELNLSQFNVVASSMGGLIAFELYRLIPERISRISFVGSLPKFARTREYPAGLDIDKIRTMSKQFQGNYASVLDIFFRSLFTMKERDSVEFKAIKQLRQTENLPDKEALLAYLTILEKTDLRDRLSSVSCPVQFIYGQEDYICTPEAMQWTQEHMPNCRLDAMEGLGHLPFLTKAKEYNEILENFLIN